MALPDSRIVGAKKKVVDGQTAHVVGRFAPFTAAAIQNMEFQALLEKQIEWMEIAVDLAQAVAHVPEQPTPSVGCLFNPS
jgi:hypothetical protein